MPSNLHQGLVEFFRAAPKLAVELLGLAGALGDDAIVEVAVVDSDLSEAAPTSLRADLVLVCRDAAGRAVRCVVVEPQLNPDPGKRRSWPGYVVMTRIREGCPTDLLVITTDEAVERWARRPIEVGAGMVCAPTVLGPSSIPRMRSLAEACARPELAVLGAVIDAREGAKRTVMFGALAADALGDERGARYYDLVMSRLDEAARAALEAMMLKQRHEYLSDYARGYFDSGARAHAIKAVLAVLTAKGLELADPQRQRIESCEDIEQLDRWHTRAVTAESVDEVFRADA